MEIGCTRGHAQARLMRLIHNKRVQHVFMVLLILDVMVIMAEMALYLEFPSCRLVQRDAVSLILIQYI